MTEKSPQANLPTNKPLRGKRCIGFGEFDRSCENMAGPNPYWCVRCDRLRIEHLDIRFKEISKAFGELR